MKVAIDAMHAAARPHHFLSVTKDGNSAIFATAGNEDTHIILRGGSAQLRHREREHRRRGDVRRGLTPKIMIDFSHANSRKKPAKQIEVGHDVAGQIARGDKRIVGVMIESHLVAGRQDCNPPADWSTARASPTPASAGTTRHPCSGSWRRRRHADARADFRYSATSPEPQSVEGWSFLFTLASSPRFVTFAVDRSNPG